MLGVGENVSKIFALDEKEITEHDCLRLMQKPVMPDLRAPTKEHPRRATPSVTPSDETVQDALPYDNRAYAVQKECALPITLPPSTIASGKKA